MAASDHLSGDQFSTWYHGTQTSGQAESIRANGLQSGLSTKMPYMTLARDRSEAAGWAGPDGHVVELHVPDESRASHLTSESDSNGMLGPARLSGIKQHLPPSMVHDIRPAG
jgi:hypothetical protein